MTKTESAHLTAPVMTVTNTESSVIGCDWDAVPPGTYHVFAATTQASTAQAEEMVRFCPHCASIGDIGDEYRDCCPDGGAARRIPKALAEVCRDTFKLAISAEAAKQAGPMTSEAQRHEAAKKSDWCSHCGQGWHCAAQLASLRSAGDTGSGG